MMMQKTIKNKLRSSYFIVTLLTIGLTISSLIGYVYFKKTQVTIDSATKLSQIMGENLAASLTFNDSRSAETILKALQVDDTIEAAYVFDSENTLFASHVNSQESTELLKKLALLQGDSHYNDTDHILVSSPILLEAQTIGRLTLIFNTDEIKVTLLEISQILLIISVLVLLIVFKVTTILQQRLTAPIYTLVDTMESILHRNDYTKRIDETSDDEFQIVFQGFNSMLDKIHHNTSELENLANFDHLTGLYNRRIFFERVSQLLEVTSETKESCFILMMDIDKFKTINDTFGHNAGDQVLQRFAQLLMAQNKGEAIIARFGGEEFIVFLPHTSKYEVRLFAENIRKDTENLLVANEISFTVSIGVSGIQNSLDDAVQVADQALYKAKNSGRNRVED